MAKKIFEIAKELDVGAIDLVEKLKTNGFSVRNHMSSLDDDDLEKMYLLFSEEKEKEEKKKTTKKKKVTKKKAASKKKVTKKKTATAVKTVASKGAEKPKKKIEDKKPTTIRKKTVIRRKANLDKVSVAADEVDVIDVNIEGADTQDVGVNLNSEVLLKDGVESSSGLRVVARPIEAKEGQSTEIESNKQDEKIEKDLFKEKVHKFTPVFIPPEQEKKKEEVVNNKKTVSEEATKEDSDAKNDISSKKRLGGLASMISTKAKGGKSRDLNLARSTAELKSYVALGSLGKPLYSQARRKKNYTGPSSQTEITEVKESKRIIILHDGGTISDISQKLSVKYNDLADRMLDLNLLVSPDDFIGIKLAAIIADLYGYRVENRAFDENAFLGKDEVSKKDVGKLPGRNPIITIMGHVDHGKTTLLDYIREEKVASGEAGGITQHIGAYLVDVKDKVLTFLDTPGHAAFASMRQRGADVTDIVVLVVAADDGVMPQTKESIKFCQLAEVPVIVAVNKMDKEGANADRVKQELTEQDITPEDWGGDTQFVPISALKGDGVDELLDAIALQAEILELKADPKAKAEGVVIESKIEQGRGPVVTVLVQSGTLKKGDSVVVGESFGRARSINDHQGNQLQDAGPSTPVQLLGLDNPPSPGDILNVVKNEREAKKIVSNRVAERKKLESAPIKHKVSLEDFFAAAQEDGAEQKSLNLIIRADVNGSYEAIRQSVEALGNKEVAVKVIGGGVGPISDSDINLASSSNGFVLGFNMRPVTSARRLSEEKGIDIKTYSIIYELINDIKLAMEGLLDPEFIEEFIGRAEVREAFLIPKIGLIAGSIVIDGMIEKGCNIRLLRDGKIVFDGKLSSLKRFKDDVKEVKSGYECGIGLEDFNDVKVSDIFEAYKIIEKKRTLEDIEQAAAKSDAVVEEQTV